MIETPDGVNAVPAHQIAPGMCGYPSCDQRATYGVQFAGWPPEKHAGACTEHVLVARSLANVEQVWSLPGALQ